MTNSKKAKEIAVKWRAKGLPYNAIYDSCLEIAKWKDEQFKQILQVIYSKTLSIEKDVVIEQIYKEYFENLSLAELDIEGGEK